LCALHIYLTLLATDEFKSETIYFINSVLFEKLYISLFLVWSHIPPTAVITCNQMIVTYL